jgi:hypothetical protein
MTDEFVYIEAARPPGTNEINRFDVYRARGGAGLGQVIQVRPKLWEAVDPDTSDRSPRHRSRDAAAAALWGDTPVPGRMYV